MMADLLNITGCNFTKEGNCTNSSFPHGTTNTTSASRMFAFEIPVVIGLLVCYVLSFIVALLGNVFGIYVVLKRSSIRNTVNWMIANLATADLMVALLVMPYYARYLFVKNKWYGGILGQISCTLIHYLFNVSVAVSILTILVISIDRFNAIVLPLRARFRLLGKPKTMACIIWLCSFCLMVANAMTPKVIKVDGNYHCLNLWKTIPITVRVLKIHYTLVFVILYAVPLIVMSLMYTLICIKLWLRKIPGIRTDNNQRNANKSRRKVIRMLIMILVLFALLWFPAHLMHYYIYYRYDEFKQIPNVGWLFSFWLCQANSAVNPILYVLMNDSFRAELRTLWYSCIYTPKRCSLCIARHRKPSSSSFQSRTSFTSPGTTGLSMEVFSKITSLGKRKSFYLSDTPIDDNARHDTPVGTKLTDLVSGTPEQKEYNC